MGVRALQENCGQTGPILTRISEILRRNPDKIVGITKLYDFSVSLSGE